MQEQTTKLTRSCPVRASAHNHSKNKKHHPVGWCFVFGAGDEARTRYLDLGKVALYQMSYARKRKMYYISHFWLCQPLKLKLCLKNCIAPKSRLPPQQHPQYGHQGLSPCVS